MQASCAVVSKKVFGNPKITSSRSAPRSMVTVDRDPEAAYAPPGEDEEDPDGIDVMEGLTENPTIEELIEHAPRGKNKNKR